MDTNATLKSLQEMKARKGSPSTAMPNAPTIREQVTNIHEALGRVGDRINHLEGMLEPVMRPAEDALAEGSALGGVVRSEVSSHLDVVETFVNTINFRLCTIIERLQV